MSLKFLIKSFDRRFLTGVLALIFLLTMALSEVSLSQESQATQEVLRKASLRWMQLGMQQYKSDLFTDAELSFRRACVFKKYLTDAERQELDEFLANARTAISEGKQAVADTRTADESVEPNQPVKAGANAEKVKDSEPSTEEGLNKISGQPSRRNVLPVTATEPSVSKIQVEAESSQDDVIVVKDESFRAKFMQLSDWLLQNRRNILMIGLPALAVLVIISKLQGIRYRPGRSVYANYVPASSSFIGSKLNAGNVNSRAIKGLRKGRLAYAAEVKPIRKSFEQSTEHWKEKHANHAPAAVEPVQPDEKWPHRKDKLQAGDSTIAKAAQKQCRKCEETKAHTDFHKNKSSKDGLASWCKECKKQYRKKSV